MFLVSNEKYGTISINNVMLICAFLPPTPYCHAPKPYVLVPLKDVILHVTLKVDFQQNTVIIRKPEISESRALKSSVP